VNAVMKKLLIGIALVAALATPATASAKASKIDRSYVKHQAWDIMKTYTSAARARGNWTYVDWSERRLIRRSRSRTIDVRFAVQFSDDWSGCIYKADHPATYWGPGGTNPAEEECPEGSIWSEEWEGKVHSWTMRFQRDRHGFIYWWFKGDRYANVDPASSRFGGPAIRKRYVSGIYEQSQWEYPLSQWEPFPPEPAYDEYDEYEDGE
jgi:hypothetical protein